jgi:hypothetical protein
MGLVPKAAARTTVIAVAGWFVYWIAYFASGVSAEGLGGWALLLGPGLALGLATGRWWTALVPFGLVVLTPLVQSGGCAGIDCSEVSIPAWVVLEGYVAPTSSIAALVGVACRRMAAREALRPMNRPR